MTDREKVEKGLNVCTSAEQCNGCPYLGERNCSLAMVRDALALLKEQEAVKPVRDTIARRFWVCGNCGEYVGFEDDDPFDSKEFDNYCRRCGKPVLWEGR
jgi:hypothetical protein